MISFLISQAVGCVVFFSINFAMYGFLKYKRNKAHRELSEPPIFGVHNLGLTLVSMIFFCGLSLRAYYLKPALDNGSEFVIEKTVLRELEEFKSFSNHP